MEINSIKKAFAVLKCFSPDEIELGAAQIAKKLGIPLSTMQHILQTLSNIRVIQRNELNGKYSIGPALYLLGSLYLDSINFVKATNPVLKVLNELTREATNLSTYSDGFITILMREESKYDFRWTRHIGSTFPAYACSMGKAFLSELPEAEIDRLYPYEKIKPITPKTIDSKTKLKLDLAQIRESGVSIDTEGSAEGVLGIGALVRDSNGKAIAAISIAAPLIRINEIQRARMVELVRMSASLINYHLGYRDQNCLVHNIQELYSWYNRNPLESFNDSA